MQWFHTVKLHCSNEKPLNKLGRVPISREEDVDGSAGRQRVRTYDSRLIAAQGMGWRPEQIKMQLCYHIIIQGRRDVIFSELEYEGCGVV